MKQNFFSPLLPLLALLLSGQPCVAGSQTDSLAQVHPWQQSLEDFAESEDFENASWEEFEDVLEEYAEHPINLNHATREELGQLPFLSGQQIEDIQHYIYRYGGMKSLGELAMISSISWYQRQLLEYFVYVGGPEKKSFPSLKNILKYGKHELVTMVKVPFYERKGDVSGYLGSRYKHWFRYQFRMGEYVKLGFLGAQDAGEPFFRAGNSWGYDFYSFCLQIKKMGRLKNLTLGRYRLQEGMGLILGSGMGFGKLSALSSMGHFSNTVRTYSSRTSANYLQGAAATFTVVPHMDVTAFVSYRTIDATLRDNGIKTIVKTGLHRTASEMAKKDVASNFLAGGNLHYSSGGLHVGATAFTTSFSKPLLPSTLLYKRYAPVGCHFWNASIDYGYISHRLSIQGETATGNCGTVATANAVSYAFSDRFSLMALQRFYPVRFYSLFSSAFGEGSDAQDESGIYIGVNWMPAAKWRITGYTDIAYFAWPKYGTSGSTSSWDNLLDVTFSPNSRFTLGARYRYKDKQGTQTQRLRLCASYTGRQWNLRTQCDGIGSKSQTSSKGWIVTQQAGAMLGRLKLNGTFGYFHTDDYASRVYCYETGLLYTMSFNSFYGEGIRGALSAKMELGRHLQAIAKLGITDYFDRDHISSGYQQIDGSVQTDLEVQLKWKI